MTNEEIKGMLKDIIDNGAEYEGRPSRKCSNCVNCRLCDWKKYKLGDEIHDDYEYRKIEKTWLEERLEKINQRRGTRLECKDIIIEVCKKILEEVEKYNENCSDIQECGIYVEPLENIIKDLGVEV